MFFIYTHTCDKMAADLDRKHKQAQTKIIYIEGKTTKCLSWITYDS